MNTELRSASAGSDSALQLWPASTGAARFIWWEQERLCHPLSTEELRINCGGKPADEATPAA